ncbi:hypothetical protein BDZ94DRAFT_1310031 [Collybia nuda]|uniref:F-box domain-containing protein n=1 Tax=Collybia nuda TaxID=64659 RepID=A0A9P6CIM1_9AGAR|nr:hypothetical protein BDZ94DRAFT_1310031 [Collybia nuda]
MVKYAWEDIQPTIELLKTHHEPASEQQIQRIRSFQKTCEFRHLVIDEEISAVDDGDCRRSLSLERERVMKQAEMCAASLAPIRRAPPEILGEIFIWCLPQTRHLNVEEAPLILCRVSRFWRYVAESTPQLWCDFSVVEDDLVRRSRFTRFLLLRQHVISIAKQWVSRAGHHLPLSLRLDKTSAARDLYTAKQLVDEVLIQNSARFRTLHLEPPTPSSFNSFFLLPSSHLPSLEHLILKVDRIQRPMLVFQSAPHLRHLSINYCASRYDRIHPFPWSQLTYLEVSSATEEVIWTNVFSQCTMLQHGIFNVCPDDPPIHRDVPRADVTYPHLHDLDVRFEGTLSELFESFHLPVLKKLCLRDFIGCHPTEMRHRLPQLDNLAFVGGIMPHITDLLELASSASELIFSGVDLFNFQALFSSLTPTPGEVPPMPNLTKLSLDIYSRFHGSRFPSQLFVDMIRTRQPPFPSHLSECTLAHLWDITLHTPANRVDAITVTELAALLPPLEEKGLVLTWNPSSEAVGYPSAWY